LHVDGDLQAAADEVKDLQREMNLARQVQQALIPKNAPEIPGLNANDYETKQVL